MHLGKEQLGKTGVGVGRGGWEIREDGWRDQMDYIVYVYESI